MKYAIFYFSPCGGTKSVADIISKELGDAPMQELTTPSMNTAIDHDTLTFFCFPVYGGRIPKPMYEDLCKVIEYRFRTEVCSIDRAGEAEKRKSRTKVSRMPRQIGEINGLV